MACGPATRPKPLSASTSAMWPSSGQSLRVPAERFAEVVAARTLQRWLAQARARAPAVLTDLSTAILELFAGIDPTGLLPASATADANLRGLLKQGEVYRRLSWARQSDRSERTVGLFGLCNGRGWAPVCL
jgi:hypothetical protein